MPEIGALLAVASSLFFVACGAGGNKLTSGPSPLVALYTVNARAGSSVAVEFGPDANYGFANSATIVPEGESKVTVLVAGMKADSTYHMRAITTLQTERRITIAIEPSRLGRFLITGSQRLL